MEDKKEKLENEVIDKNDNDINSEKFDESKTIKEEEGKKKQRKSFSEVCEDIDDAVEDVYTSVDEAFYGDTHDYTHDIPAMMERPDRPRVINKVQTRRNIINRVLSTNKKKFIFLGVILAAMIIGLVVSFIG